MYQEKHYQEAEITVTFQPIDLCAECGFLLGNAIKYILRANYKGHAKEDYIKARDYLQFFHDRKKQKDECKFSLKLSARAVVCLMEYWAINPFLQKLLKKESDFYESEYNFIHMTLLDLEDCIQALNEEITLREAYTTQSRGSKNGS